MMYVYKEAVTNMYEYKSKLLPLFLHLHAHISFSWKDYATQHPLY